MAEHTFKMSSPAKKFIEPLQNEKILTKIANIIKRPFVRLQRRKAKKQRMEEILKLHGVEERFHAIYQKNVWGSVESVSGSGSTLRYTENLRKELPKLIADLSIKRIFDAPCGDFNWMQFLLPTIDVSYVGADIVRPLIESHKQKHENEKTSFLHLDLINDSFPAADLMICRDCLFHLSYQDTRSVLKNFVDSGIPYLLTTTHKDIDGLVNKDIATGDFRPIYLFSAPYNFPKNPLASIDDWMAPEPERQMCLWSSEQIASALTKFC